MPKKTRRTTAKKAAKKPMKKVAAKKVAAKKAAGRDAAAARAAARGLVQPRPAAPREKRSVTLDQPVADAVDRLVAEGAAASFSAAMNEAAARWAGNRALRRALDDIYVVAPDARPSEEEIAEAAARLGYS